MESRFASTSGVLGCCVAFLATLWTGTSPPSAAALGDARATFASADAARNPACVVPECRTRQKFGGSSGGRVRLVSVPIEPVDDGIVGEGRGAVDR